MRTQTETRGRKANGKGPGRAAAQQYEALREWDINNHEDRDDFSRSALFKKIGLIESMAEVLDVITHDMRAELVRMGDRAMMRQEGLRPDGTPEA